MIFTATCRTLWRHKGTRGSARLTRVALPWNAGGIYVVLAKRFRERRLRIIYAGPSRPAAVAIYAQVKSEVS